jgi:geranylgeranyl diphosphate synthase type I
MTAAQAADTSEALLSRSRVVVEPALRQAIDTLPGSLRHVAGYHFGWWDAQGSPESAGSGKALRPALTLLAAEMVGGSAEQAVHAAVAVELVHNFSLIHDDVMDSDAVRRHRPTVWKVFGSSAAILAGDALLNLAFEVLASGGHPQARAGHRLLSAAVTELLEGQADDLAFEQRDNVVLAECLSMAKRKTGALLDCSCGVGALFGGGTAEQVESLRSFGANLGLAFQIVDDLLGIWGDPARTGKPVYSDLRSRKKSLPVVAALGSASPQRDQLALAYRDEGPLSDMDLSHLAGLIEAAGGRDWCHEQSAMLLDQALEVLGSDCLPGDPAGLTALATFITSRDR